MAASILQHATNTATSATSITCAFASPVTPGSVLVAVYTPNSATSTVVTDSLGNTYDAYSSEISFAQSAGGGANTITVTTSGGSALDLAIAIIEVAGITEVNTAHWGSPAPLSNGASPRGAYSVPSALVNVDLKNTFCIFMAVNSNNSSTAWSMNSNTPWPTYSVLDTVTIPGSLSMVVGTCLTLPDGTYTPDVTGPLVNHYGWTGTPASSAFLGLWVLAPIWDIYIPPPPTPMPTWTDQSARLHMADSIKFSSIARQRGTAEVSLYIPAGDSYGPTIGSQVCIWDLTETADYEVFSGTIDEWETKWFGVDGDRVITLTCVSLESVFDTIRVPSNLWEGQTAGFIFNAVFAYANGSPIALGTVDDGATLANFATPDWPTIAEVFDRLATESEYVWGVDPGTGELYFNAPNTTPSPFTLDSEAVLWEQLTKREERHDYRNQQIMKVPSDVAVLSSELFAGAGQTSFTLLRPVQQVTNGWTTKNVQNHATLTLSGQPAAGNTISFQFVGSGSIFNWAAATPYTSGQVIVDVNGYLQKCTAGGTTGGSQPVWVETYGTITTDNTVAWTNQGPAGFANGDIADYTFVTALDNTQFGEILIGANVAATCQNIADAINGLITSAGITFSLPTWENPQVNADEPAGATTVVVRNKAAGAGFVVALAKVGANLAWSGSVTSGGSTTFGTQAVTVGVQGQTTGGTDFTIVYTPGSDIVTSATPLPAGTSLQIEYSAVNAQFIRVENSADVTARAAIEQSTGKYQQQSNGDGSLSLPAFLAQAQAQLTAYGVIPSTFEFTTMWAGLYVGQVLTIVMSNPVNAPVIINGDWYVQEINAESVPVYNEAGEPDRFLPGGGHFRYTIRCISTNQIGDWIDFWKGMKSGSGGGSGQVITGGGSLGAGSAGAGYSAAFTCVAGTPLAITHGLNTTKVIAAAYDSGGVAVDFGGLVITSANVITITFGLGFTGTIVVIPV